MHILVVVVVVVFLCYIYKAWVVLRTAARCALSTIIARGYCCVVLVEVTGRVFSLKIIARVGL